MRAFIMLVDESTWEVVKERWRKPKVTRIGGATKSKEKNQYTPKEKKVAQANSKALYMNFNGTIQNDLNMWN